jgi:hypothetical protein
MGMGLPVWSMGILLKANEYYSDTWDMNDDRAVVDLCIYSITDTRSVLIIVSLQP